MQDGAEFQIPSAWAQHVPNARWSADQAGEEAPLGILAGQSEATRTAATFQGSLGRTFGAVGLDRWICQFIMAGRYT